MLVLPKWLWMHTSEWPWCRMIWTGIQSGFGTGLSFLVATTLQSVDIQGWSRTGVNNMNIRNIVLSDHRAPKRNTRKWRSSLCTSDWRLEEQVVLGDLQGCTCKKAGQSPHSFSHKSTCLVLINEIRNCSHWLTNHTLYALLVNRLFALRLNWLWIQCCKCAYVKAIKIQS